MDGRGGKRPGAGRPRKADQSDHVGRFNKARAEKEEAIARIRKLEGSKLAGELISTEEAEETILSIVSVAKSRLLAMPSRLSADLEGEDDIRAIESRILEEVHKVLEEMSVDVGGIADTKESGKSVSATS